MGTDLCNLQLYLRDTGRFEGILPHDKCVDGLWGRATEKAIMVGFEDGPDTVLTEADYAASAARLHCPVSHIKAVASVEASGAGFQDGLPKILPERHRFSKLTNHRFDEQYPALSYPKWGRLPYPKTQESRYSLLLAMIRLDIDAGFAACSYGKFQILGENHAACGYGSSSAFAFAQAIDEKRQLEDFEKFLQANHLLTYLQQGIWTKFASGYNGPAYRENRYDVKLAQAARNFEHQADSSLRKVG